LIFRRNEERETMEVYCDTDFANSKEDSKSISGVITFHHGNAIGWSSHSQPTVSISTCESEVLAIGEGCQDAVYLIHLIRELSENKNFGPIKIFNDNQSAIRTIESGGKFKSNRHYLTKINFIRDFVKRGFIQLEFKQTDEMLADGLTKALAKTTFNELFTLCGINPR
jgi:hypothetical protein